MRIWRNAARRRLWQKSERSRMWRAVENTQYGILQTFTSVKTLVSGCSYLLMFVSQMFASGEGALFYCCTYVKSKVYVYIGSVVIYQDDRSPLK